MGTCEGKMADWTTKYNQCTSAKSILEVTITNINKKTVLDCKDTTTIITNQLTNCKQDIEKGIAKYDQCNKTNITLKVEIEKQITIISNVTKECQGKIDKKITDIRDEEKSECKKKIDIEITHYKTCESEKITIISQITTCRADLAIYIKLKGWDVKLIKCDSDLVDAKKSITQITINYNAQITIVKNLEIKIGKITIDYEKCEKDKNSDILKVDLDMCRKLKDEKISLIKQLKIFIDKSFLEFRMTISEMRLSYNSRIQKLLIIISSTKSSQSTTKTTIESHTTKIDSNNTDKEGYEKQIKELREKIIILIKQRTDFLSKLDTIDSTSITLITEIKVSIINIQSQIDDNTQNIRNFEILLIQINREIYKYQGEIEVLKKNLEEYQDMMEKYEEIKTSLEEYIKKLENIIKKKNHRRHR